MDAELLFKLTFAAIVIAFMAHRGYYHRKFARSANSIVKQPDVGTATKIGNLIAIPAVLSTLAYLAMPAFVAWASLPFAPWFRWLGVGLAISGFGLLQWSHWALGSNWSDEPILLQGQQMVSKGPYRWIRHPIYAAFLLIIGSSLPITANGLLGALWIAMTALSVSDRIRIEEDLMLAQFGEEYRAYMHKTGRLLPRILRRS